VVSDLSTILLRTETCYTARKLSEASRKYCGRIVTSVLDIDRLITRELRGRPRFMVALAPTRIIFLFIILFCTTSRYRLFRSFPFTRFLLRSRHRRVLLPWSWPVLFNALWMKDRTGVCDITDSRPQASGSLSPIINSPSPPRV
jgi:hypothetical protein